eukprot:scaffold121408_cov30-Tisochrysis_lutea.AAC.14
MAARYRCRVATAVIALAHLRVALRANDTLRQTSTQPPQSDKYRWCCASPTAIARPRRLPTQVAHAAHVRRLRLRMKAAFDPAKARRTNSRALAKDLHASIASRRLRAASTTVLERASPIRSPCLRTAWAKRPHSQKANVR